MSRTVARAWVRNDVLSDLIVEADRVAPLETGGVLMGYRAERVGDVVITDAAGPGPRARHEAGCFQPDAAYHEQVIARRYLDSRRTITYLGDWHTHPDGGGRLSARDRRTLFRIASFREARARTPLMAVLRGGFPWELVIWRASPRVLGIASWRYRVQQLRVTVHG